MEGKTDFKIKVYEECREIGRGDMFCIPRQVGDWWVTPAEDYNGKIPVDIQQKMFAFINSGEPFVGFLIAEDMREIEARREKEAKKKELKEKQKQANRETVEGILKIAGLTVAGMAMMTVYAISAVIAYDPMLIVVTPDGRFLCLGTWYE